MKTRSILVAAWVAMFVAPTVQAQFVPGHVFVAESAGKLCAQQHIFGHDRIWEIDPETGEVSVFVQIPEEMCGFLTGLAFTPDGTRLRASSWLRSEILEFDSDGNISIALDFSDGIAAPWGFNNIAYDAQGNFYVANQTGNILRFPADGGPPTVFADETDGVGNGGAIAFAADGDLYLARAAPGNIMFHITPQGKASIFEDFGPIISPNTVTADESGNVYVALDSSEVFRYKAGDSGSKEFLALVPCAGRCSMTMSPDQSKIYHQVGRTLYSVDVLGRTLTTVGEIPPDAFLGFSAGIAVVPIPPPPIPIVSAWALCVMTLLMLTVGTIMIQRYRRVIV